MLRNSLDDPSVPITRWFLRACAVVSRQSAEDPVEYRGVLSAEPEIGAPLVLVLDGRRRLRTTAVTGIESVSDDAVCVETLNSRYLVRRLFQPGGLR